MKKSLIVLLVLLLAFSMIAAGCKKAEEAPVEEPAAEEVVEEAEEAAEEAEDVAAGGEPVTVTWWHTFTEGQKDTLEAIIAEFNELNPEINVVAESQPYDGFLATVYEAVANGVGPDIIYNYASIAPDFVEDELILDLSEYLTDADYKDRVSEGVYAESTEAGGLYAIAVQTTGPIFFYNKSIFDDLGIECPATWDDVEAAAKKIYEETGIAGFAFDSLTDGFQTLIQQSGIDYVDLENNELLFNTPEYVAWLEWFSNGVKEGYFSLAPVKGNYFSNDMSGETREDKALASYVGSSAGLPYLDLGSDELATAPMPRIEGGVDWVPAWNRAALVFTSTPEKEAAAAEFIKFFTNAENAARWVESLNAFTPYKDSQELESYQAFVEGNIALVALGQQIDYAAVLPTFNGANAVRDAIADIAKQAAVAEDADAIQTIVDNGIAAAQDAMND